MVKGNKFKPGEPPKKKRKIQESLDALGQTSHSFQALPNSSKSPSASTNDRVSHLKPVQQKPVTEAAPRETKENSQHARQAVRNNEKRARDQDGEQIHGISEGAKRQKLGKGLSGSQIARENGAPPPRAATGDGEQPGKAHKISKALLTNQRKKARRKAKLLARQGDAAASSLTQAENQRAQDSVLPPSGATGAGPPIPKAGTQPPDRRDGSKGDQKVGGQKSAGIRVQTRIAPPKQGSTGNSNWDQIKKLIGAGTKKTQNPKGEAPLQAADSKRPEAKGKSTEVTPVVAIDCEMVGVGPDGIRSSLARVCIVNEQGNVLMDKHVKQKEKVTDYRTKFSGIRPEDVSDKNAEPLEDIQKEAAEIMKNRIVVGHAVHNDFRALLLGHPNKLIRDTAKYPPLMRPGGPGRKPKPKALRHLAFEQLGLGIQSGEHSPVEDARATLYLYQKHAKEWERHLKQGGIGRLTAPPGKKQQNQKMQKGLEELAAKDVMVDL